MFSTKWQTSRREYGIIVEKDVKIPMPDGTLIDADIFRPDSDKNFPAIFGYSPYPKAPQTSPIQPEAISASIQRLPGKEKATGYLEAGDPNFFVRRGYAQIVANARGTGKSTGKYPFVASPEPEDGAEVIEWIARQPWCDGNVGMFGISYFGWIQLYIAELAPPALKCLFAPWAASDLYRDSVYHGGILGHGFWRALAPAFHHCKAENQTLNMLGEEGFKKAVAKALEDEDIAEVPELVEILKNPGDAAKLFIQDFILNPLDGPYWKKRQVQYDKIKIPAYIGGCWGHVGLHLPAAFRSWEKLDVPKKMIIGPQAFVDRPFYQLGYQSLRWFDYWLKGMENGIMDEPNVRVFQMGTGEWKESKDWPLPETRWTPFYLHENGLLWEHEFAPHEGCDSFDDSPWYRGFLEYTSPPMVEDTDIIGPIVLNLYASTNDTDILWFVSLRELDKDGNERVLTRGWLRGSHREVDKAKSKPWYPYHPHDKSVLLEPEKIYEFNIPLVPTGNVFKQGSRIKLKIAGKDDIPANPLEGIASGHIWRQNPSRITIYHDEENPSHLLLPITRGNIMETYISGGKPYI
ncbi:CocE/NonD family hydrolase [Chloroflexota bacterium]